MRGRWIFVAALISGCSERALDHCVGEDFAEVRDLSVADFAMGSPDQLLDFSHTPEDPCPAGARFIFTIDDRMNGFLSRWNPNTKQFFPVGAIKCPTTDGVNSMAVDHNGVGWANFSGGELFRIDTTTASCSATPFDPSADPDFISEGMSFAQDMPGNSQVETLFIADQEQGLASLGTIDLQKFVATTVATLSINGHPELTGDNKAQLWGFFPDAAMPQVGRIDKMSGNVDQIVQLPMLAGQPSAWAFAAWDGDFYIFLQRNADPSTTIYLLHADGTLDTALANTNLRILGVGVATCAGNPVPDM